MNKINIKVLEGYSKLSHEDRKEIRLLIERFEETASYNRDSMIKALNESVGPLGLDNCPCCGK